MSTQPLTILWVDEVSDQTRYLASVLESETRAGVLLEPDPVQALNLAQNQEIDLCLINLSLTQLSLPDFIPRLKEIDPTIVTIVAVTSGQRQELVQALSAGAHFHLFLPYEHAEVVLVATRGLKHRELLLQAGRSRPSLRQSDGFHGIIGVSTSMRRVFDLIERIAAHDQGTVLIQGESGTGKELVARAIHDLSPRAGQPFMTVNCAAIPDELLESEFFGYEKGAFTGADQSKKGRIALADQGTVFLDEIGDMKLSLQSKILRVLQEQEVEPVGAGSPVPVNVRIIAATHANLDQAVQEGRFRQDLYYRLSVVPLNIPALRERPEDIPALVNTFIMMYNRGVKFGVQRFSNQAIQALQAYPWPGNIRELENLVQRMCILHCEQTVHLGDLPPKYRGYRRSDRQTSITSAAQNMGNIDFYSRMSELEDQLIMHALRQSKGNKKLAAQLLNMKRTTLLEKIKKKKLGPVLDQMLKKNSSSPANVTKVM